VFVLVNFYLVLLIIFNVSCVCVCVCVCVGLRRQIAGERAPETWRSRGTRWVSESESETMVGRERGGVGVGGDGASRNRQAVEE
jgi:hypothetical protein